MSSGLSDLVGPLNNLLKFKNKNKKNKNKKAFDKINLYFSCYKKKKKKLFQIEFENQQKSGVGSGTRSL